ncbi:MAG: carboxypeptidase-like regulatory domain-containing protein [Patescibacteria group bacterium]|nr:carboxypeptidase-like regulatory domain-containing protein [Patescibacteria group bacterium]
MLKKTILGVLVSAGFIFPISSWADPIANVPITVTKGEKIYSTTTGEDGKFTITKLPLGKYTISIPIRLEIISIDLSINGRSHISISSKAVDTHIVLTRNRRMLSGEITEDVILEPIPTISPLPYPSLGLTPPTPLPLPTLLLQPSLLPSLFPVPTLNQ